MSRPRIDYRHEVREHASPAVRALFLLLGTLFVAIGLLGVVLPVLPTTPFLLLAAGCYVRASGRFYNWLLNSGFGPLIIEWRRHRSIPWRTKITAIVLMTATLSSSIIFFVRNPYLQGALTMLGIALAVWLYRIPSRDRPREGRRVPRT